MFVESKPSYEIKKEVERFEKLLTKLDNNLKEDNRDYFGNGHEISAIDLVIFFEISTIITMCST